MPGYVIVKSDHDRQYGSSKKRQCRDDKGEEHENRSQVHGMPDDRVYSGRNYASMSGGRAGASTSGGLRRYTLIRKSMHLLSLSSVCSPPGGRQETASMFLGQALPFCVLSRAPSEICAGRLCRGRERWSPSKSEMEPGTARNGNTLQ